MAKYQVLRDCYGFQNRYWEKGMIVDIDPKENPPHHFKLVSDPTIVSKEKEPHKEASTAVEIAREEMLAEVKSRGIKDAEFLNQDELLEVLAKDISRQKITAIIQKAKARQQKK